MNINRSPSSASSTQADFQQTYPEQIVIQLAINSGKSLLSQFRLTQQRRDQRKQARAEHAEIWQNRCHQTKHYPHSDKFQANFRKTIIGPGTGKVHHLKNISCQKNNFGDKTQARVSKLKAIIGLRTRILYHLKIIICVRKKIT